MTVRVARLDEIAEVLGGGTPARSQASYFGGEIAWATPTDITSLDKLHISATKETVTQSGLQNSSTKLMPAGAVLLTSRATIGFTAVSTIPICTNQGFVNFVCGPDLQPEFLAYWLRTQREKMIQHAGGTTFKEIARGTLRKFEISLPSLLEQRRLVDLLSRAEGIVRLRREAQRKANELVPALFLDMFGDPASNPKGWPVVELGELIVDGPQNGLYKHKSLYGDGTPILRIDGFYDGAVNDLASLQRVRLAPEEIERYGLTSGEIVINRVNSPEYLGKSALIPDLHEPTVFESNMMRLRLDTGRIEQRFAIAALQMDAIRKQILASAKHAINQSSINQQDVKALRFSLPPIELQRQFSAKVDAIDGITVQQDVALATAQAAFDALLHQSFQH